MLLASVVSRMVGCHGPSPARAGRREAQGERVGCGFGAVRKQADVQTPSGSRRGSKDCLDPIHWPAFGLTRHRPHSGRSVDPRAASVSPRYRGIAMTPAHIVFTRSGVESNAAQRTVGAVGEKASRAKFVRAKPGLVRDCEGWAEQPHDTRTIAATFFPCQNYGTALSPITPLRTPRSRSRQSAAAKQNRQAP